jgi:predicted DsbA family dithiol-disulfide isomerase
VQRLADCTFPAKFYKEGVGALGIVVYSDFLCPWCYNVTVRMRRLEAEFGAQIEIDWRTYLLRPVRKEGRDPDRFRAYTQSWRIPAAEDDAGTFRTWEGAAPPPTHSTPAHIVAKAAAALGPDAGRRMHDRLLVAYFAENLDISATNNLRALWLELELPALAFPDLDDPERVQTVLDEHAEAVALGLTGVPAARLRDNPAFVTGALPYAMYQRWVERHLSN